jgi:hypothetical protein
MFLLLTRPVNGYKIFKINKLENWKRFTLEVEGTYWGEISLYEEALVYWVYRTKIIFWHITNYQIRLVVWLKYMVGQNNCRVVVHGYQNTKRSKNQTQRWSISSFPSWRSLKRKKNKWVNGDCEIRTHASFETATWVRRLRPTRPSHLYVTNNKNYEMKKNFSRFNVSQKSKIRYKIPI